MMAWACGLTFIPSRAREAEMTILQVMDPPAARKVAEEVLSRSDETASAAAFAATPVGALGLYNIKTEDLLARRFAKAEFTGWRYVQLEPGAEVGRIIEVSDDFDPKVAATADGSLAGTIAKSGREAEELLSAVPE